MDAAPDLVAETDRLVLRRFAREDAPFILALQTEPAWQTHIGSRGVTDLATARAYLEDGPLASYAAHGFGLYRVALRETGEPVGLCGVLWRDGLDAPDLGYAILTAHHGRGYATEAARATLAHARTDLGLGRVLAVTSRDNRASQRVLEKVGMRRAGTTLLAGDGEPSLLYST